LATTSYIEANCEEFLYRKFKLLMHKKPMPKSPAFFETINKSFITFRPKNENSGQYILLKEACDLINKKIKF